MLLKQISAAAALAVTIVAGSAAVAHAESNVSGVDGGLTSESTLQRASRYYGNGYAYAAPYAYTGARSYGYAGGKRHLRPHTRTHTKMKRHN